MACSKPMAEGQSPSLCRFCEVDPKIQWKCVDCDLLLCTKCKDKIHSKVKTAEEHKIINIKAVGTPSVQNTIEFANKGPLGIPSVTVEKTVPGSDNKGLINLEVSVVHDHYTELGANYIQVSMDDSLWNGENKNIFSNFKSSTCLEKVKLEKDGVKTIYSINVDFRDIAITPSNDLILVDNSPRLKQISHNASMVIESIYCVEPYKACSVHVTRENKVVVGVDFGLTGAVYVMDKSGVRQEIFPNDQINKPIFTWPYRITSSSTGILYIIDRLPFLKARLVILGQEEVISVYSGHPIINDKKREFKPRDVVSTSNDNILVVDPYNYVLHILNNVGSFLTYYDTQKIGRERPISLAFTTEDQFSILYIGCWSHDEKDGKLKKLKFSGC